MAREFLEEPPTNSTKTILDEPQSVDIRQDKNKELQPPSGDKSVFRFKEVTFSAVHIK